ncbi:hypothetical protein D3C85_1298400 [compost metagenome]
MATPMTRSTSLRWVVKMSRIGRFCTAFFATRDLNTSVSCTDRRIHRVSTPISAAMMKATRQPQSSRAVSLPTDASTKPSRKDTRVPALIANHCQEPAKARRSDGADSIRKAEAEPNSPPAEKPWVRRARTRMIGAAMPMLS